MIIAHHAIFSLYGFWLPNDPRGSYSDFVAAWDLFRAGGKATFTNSRSFASAADELAERERLKQSLKRPAVVLDGLQARALARGFAGAARDGGYPIHACAIMHDHVHMVIGLHPRRLRQIVGHLRAAATKQLKQAQLHPFQGQTGPGSRTPSCWSESCWDAFLYDADDVYRAVNYVAENLVREGLRPQSWSFVTPWQPG